jgi:hypothetical protein
LAQRRTVVQSPSEDIPSHQSEVVLVRTFVRFRIECGYIVCCARNLLRTGRILVVAQALCQRQERLLSSLCQPPVMRSDEYTRDPG